jgi:hypothetical protein
LGENHVREHEDILIFALSETDENPFDKYTPKAINDLPDSAPGDLPADATKMLPRFVIKFTSLIVAVLPCCGDVIFKG